MRRICPRCQERFADDVERCPTDNTALRVDPFIGTRIAHWTLTDFVGQGAKGVVYAAEPTAAIKILHARRAAMQPELVRRFEIEADASMRMTSRHIARVFDSGTTEDGHLYIAMELLRGEPLDAILARSPRLPQAAAATIAHQIALALEETHAVDVVHRDLKPANIFVEPAPGGGRHVRVLDFGVARINSESVARSRTGSVAGTPAFMSPEQLRGEPDIDGRSDIYSLGVVLYQLLAGFNPFRGPGGVMGTLRRHLELEPPPIADVSPLLDDVVHRMLAKHREARPQTMALVQQLLTLTGLVGGGGDSQTIPGISREMLAAAGVYEAAPDPELRPLVKPFVRSVEVGQPSAPVASHPVAPVASPPAAPMASPPVEPVEPVEAPDPAMQSGPPTPSVDTSGASPATRRSGGRGWLWALGLIATGALAGLGFVWASDESSADLQTAAQPADVEEPPPETIPAPSPGSSDIASLLAEGQRALDAKRWRPARERFDEILRAVPDHAEALAGRDHASREANAQRLWSELQEAIDLKWWKRAMSILDDFPKDSAYTEDAEALRATIEAGYVQQQLIEGRRLIGLKQFRSAEIVQEDLATKPYAVEAAETLADEISAARKQYEAKQKRAPRGKSSGGPPGAAGPPTRSRKPATTDELSFDELITRALRKMMRGDRDAAIVFLEQAARKRPRSHLPHQRLCAIYKAQQKFKAALASCEKWRELEPNASYRPAIERNIKQLQELINN